MPLHLVQNDITRMQTDAIVNAANSALTAGGGVCGAIFSAAGREKMTAACAAIGHCPVGSAVMTDGFALPAKHVIHAVGPVWTGGGQGEAALLRSCYERALHLAAEHGCESVAFPLISSGIYGYPKAEALRIALDTIAAFLMERELQVYLVVYDRAAVRLGAALTDSLEQWLDTFDHARRHRARREAERQTQLMMQSAMFDADASLYAGGSCYADSSPCADASCYADLDLYEYADAVDDADAGFEPAFKAVASCSKPKPMASAADWERFDLQPGETFSEQLLRRIDEQGMTDVETYKRANLDRRLFSKIRSRKDYTPSRQTAIALAIALRLTIEETTELLASAGYALSDASRFDLIVRFFIETGDYDVFRINEALFHYGEPLLGA